jgi:hypothetical protein
MRQPIDQLPSRFIVDEGASGIYVIEFRSVMVEAEPGKNEMSKLLMQKSYSDAQVQAYIHSLRQLMNVKFKSKSLESKSS